MRSSHQVNISLKVLCAICNILHIQSVVGFCRSLTRVMNSWSSVENLHRTLGLTNCTRYWCRMSNPDHDRPVMTLHLVSSPFTLSDENLTFFNCLITSSLSFRASSLYLLKLFTSSVSCFMSSWCLSGVKEAGVSRGGTGTSGSPGLNGGGDCHCRSRFLRRSSLFNLVVVGARLFWGTATERSPGEPLLPFLNLQQDGQSSAF